MPTIAISFYDQNGLVKWVKGKKNMKGKKTSSDNTLDIHRKTRCTGVTGKV